MKTPLIPTSWGELLDKITILEIKASQITNERSLINIQNELEKLQNICAELSISDPKLNALKSDLSSVNKALWDIEDKLREKEKAKLFDHEFIELARTVYRQNDRRAAIKREINEYLHSELVEEKSYRDY